MVAFACGQAANSQFGPVLPTALPSGQIFASAVQAWGVIAIAQLSSHVRKHFCLTSHQL